MLRADRSRVPEPGPVPAVRFPAVRAVRLPNGMATRMVQHPGPPVVTFLLTMPAGSASDPAGQAGLAALTADLLDEGSDERTALELHAALDRIGGRLGTEVGSDATKVSLTTLSRSAAEGLALLAEIVARPRFDEADVTRVRDLRLSQLRQLRTVPGAVGRSALSGNPVSGAPIWPSQHRHRGLAFQTDGGARSAVPPGRVSARSGNPGRRRSADARSVHRSGGASVRRGAGATGLRCGGRGPGRTRSARATVGQTHPRRPSGCRPV